jgi:hypothetical protein
MFCNQALPENIRLGHKLLKLSNLQACYSVTFVLSFEVQTKKQFMDNFVMRLLPQPDIFDKSKLSECIPL